MMQKFTATLLLAGALAAAPSPTRADITIAVVGGMSGPFTQIGSWFKRGAAGAIDEVNAKGGVLGQKIKFITRDDECKPAKARKIAEEMVRLKVPFVMGHLCSDASIAASDIYEKNGIIEISPASTNPALTDRGFANIFRTTGRDDMQGFVIAEHILRHFKTKKLGIVFDNSAYSRGVVKVAKKFLNEAGLKELVYAQAPGKPFDFSSILNKLESAGVEVVLYPANPDELTNFLTQADGKSLKVQVIGGDSFTNVTLPKKDIRLLNGVQFSFPPDPAHDRRNKKIVKKYKAEGFKAEAFTFFSYGAVQVWAQAAQKAGSVEAAKVSKVLKSDKFDTVLGKIGFDQKGDISNPGFVIYFYNKGKKYYFE